MKNEKNIDEKTISGYALGRFSYSPYDVAPLLIKNKDKLKDYKVPIIKDIEWFLAREEENHPKDLIELWKNVKIEMERIN